ncbi:putative RuBisCO transcriptional regulator [uncultured Alphaproteobacteria bacterium]|jgi:DNA-binding transcriptional LysR family regulator|uniref:Putative RuBisCO transcriptional regulator n=1 Tax=uncultured Alphaproteobacteria bacterium TaxID=91750 RepID=A0A212JRX2_9PROT|nr:putative RuBisCO transcriptional regulator [uncultured Alphaproteobacteria bacterium]
MDLRKLQTFVAVADFGSFSRAAQAVNLTQSAVSQQMVDLEHQLHVALFDRSTRPPRMTRAGRAYVETARAILDSHALFVERYGRAQVSGTLTIGVVRSALSAGLPEALHALKVSHPRLSLRLVASGRLTTELTQEVRAGRLDAALVVGPPAADRDLLWKSYAVERFYVIAPPGTPGLTDGEVLSSAPYLRFVPILPGEREIDSVLAKKGLTLVPEMELDTFEAIVLMAGAGLGAGIVPALYVPRARLQDMRVLPFGDHTLTRELGILTRRPEKKGDLIDLLHKTLTRVRRAKSDE